MIGGRTRNIGGFESLEQQPPTSAFFTLALNSSPYPTTDETFVRPAKNEISFSVAGFGCLMVA
jgi:hypothetical protein